MYSVFRLVDALLLRPLPIENTSSLYAMVLRGVGPDGSVRDSEWSEYPQFQLMREAVRADAELIAISGADSVDLTVGSEQQMERAHRQFVSGWIFSSFGLKPTLGRLLAQSDDNKFKASPLVVLSYEYWSRRLGTDHSVLGRKLRMGSDLYEIVGVGIHSYRAKCAWCDSVHHYLSLPQLLPSHYWCGHSKSRLHRAVCQK